MIEIAGKILIREMRKAVDSILNCVTPMFHVNDNGEPELVGSAVLIQVSGNTFICTAKHVLETARSRFYIDGPSAFEVLTGEFYRSKQYDVAVLKLTPEQVLSFQKYIPLPEGHIANQTQAETCSYVEFLGFPGTKNRAPYKGYKLPKHIYSFGCTVLQITPEQVRVKFSKHNMDSKSGKRVTSPDPYGVSGGAMMGISMNDATITGKPYPRLIGITTDYIATSNEVFGPCVAILIATIREGWDITLPLRLGR